MSEKVVQKTIWKFPLKVTDGQNISMPKDAEILTVQAQGSEVVLWALVDPDAFTEIRFFEMFGTGHHVGYDSGVSREYISTIQLHDGSLVLHVFEYTGV